MPSYRILMLATCPFPAPQGTQVCIQELAEELAGAGHRVTLITYGFGEGELSNPSFVHRRAPSVPGHGRITAGPSWERPLADALLVWEALRACREASQRSAPFHLVHGHNYEGGIAAAMVGVLAGLPSLYHAHNLMEDELPSYFASRGRKRAASFLGKMLDASVPGWSDAAVSVSQSALETIRRFHPAQDVTWLPPSISSLPEAVEPQERPNPAELVYLGNLDGYQNLGLLLEALSILKRRGVRCRGVIVTREPLDSLDRELSRRDLADIVFLAPHRSFAEAVWWMKRARIALLPRTVRSGYPIKLVNYMMAALPVVACEGGANGLGLKEGVRTCPDNDAEAFADALEELLGHTELRKTLGAAAKAASVRFSSGESLQTLEEVYERLIQAV